ncbi:zinc-dependent alcohol dehydrogenase [Herbiconiux liangxiaofengii]|uniref:zinc-dependent alcohol dehydrogenase n=1 Tax=Herbiconiux liangxiaofengii TaxID=3342795 RepID=UPI0035BB2D9D
MRAAVYHGDHDIRVAEVPAPSPEPGSGEVLLRVVRSGLCGTDATEWAVGPKVFPVTVPHRVTGHVGPMVPGHEFVGEVVTADASTGFQPGDRVASGAGVWCGTCARCLEGRTNLCERYYTFGLSTDGGMAEYVAVPARTLARIPEGLSFDHAALAQPLAVGIHAARRSGARTGDRVLIIGGGAIASFVLAGLRHLVDASVVVVEFPGPKQARALRFGAAAVVSPSDALADEVVAAFGGVRPDVVIEASGAPGQLATAVSLVRDGGRVLAVGLPKAKPELDVHSLVFREVTIESSLAHVCDDDLGPALDILAEGVVGPELLVDVVPLSALGEQLELLVQGKLDGKVLIDPWA